LRALATHYAWRHLPDSHEAFGIHRGIGVHVREYDGVLLFVIFAPGANVGDEILEDFKGFAHCARAGLPTNWIRCWGADDTSCRIWVGGRQIEELGAERVLAIPDLMAGDFHTHGAAESMVCHDCGERPATEVRVVGGSYYCVCQHCLQLLTIRTV